MNVPERALLSGWRENDRSPRSADASGPPAEKPNAISGLVGTGYVAGGAGFAIPGAPDGNFTLISCPSGPCPNQPYVALTGDSFPGPWLPNTSSAQWIGPAKNGLETGIDPTGVYDYRETFDLTGLDLTTVSVSGSFAADDAATLQLNGVPVGFSSPGYGVWTAFTLSSGFRPGVNTIDFMVTNYANGFFNPSGLMVELIGTGSPPPTRTTLVAAPTTLLAGQAVTLTGTVRGMGNPPTGEVGFLNGSALLASASLDGSGVATATIYPPAGVYSLVAGYQGDRANGQSESAPVTVTVYAGPPGFAITTGGPLTLETQHHGSVAVTVTPQNGFSGDVTLGCGSLPEYVTCEWGPGLGGEAQVQVSGGPVTISLEIDTSAVLGYEASRDYPGGTGLGFALPALCVMLAERRRFRLGMARLVPMRMTIAVFVLCMAGSLSGCSSKFPPSTPAGTYSLQILGTSGAVKSSGSLELIVNK